MPPVDVMEELARRQRAGVGLKELGSGLSWACALSPAGLFLVVIGLAVHVRLGLGHWPTPMIEDYRTVGMQLHWALLSSLGLFAVYGAAPLWILCVLIWTWRLSARVHLAQAVCFLLGWGLLAGLVALDPYRFVTWMAD